MLSKGTDGLETWLDKIPHLFAELIQFFRGAHFGNPALTHILFQPFHEPDMSHTVLDLCMANIFDLHRILDRLEQDLRIPFLNPHHILRDAPIQRIV